MPNVILPHSFTYEEKRSTMAEDSQYEMGCSVDAENAAVNAAMQLRAKPCPPKIPKLYLCGRCTFNCAYCGCRATLERKCDYLSTPRELAEMAYREAIKNGHGVFLSSAIYKCSDTTQEMLAEATKILRTELGYTGFIHTKVMPGADPRLITETGKYASRLSVNIEVARSNTYKIIAKQKNKENIIGPMSEVASQIKEHKYNHRTFAYSQTTQLMAGAAHEDDRTILTLAEALYRKFRLKRVYYTNFTYRFHAKGYENLDLQTTPAWRSVRLYEADRLMQNYGFSPDEIAPEEAPLLNERLDPKTAYALRNISMFPIEVNTADYDTLLRVPGIGTTYAKRIIEARRYSYLSFDTLKMMKISLKKAKYFITCGGRFIGGSMTDPEFLTEILSSPPTQISIQ
ncbi:MAG: helix-hairpin-helix domain-containing protein [Eubacteriales bacterium]